MRHDARRKEGHRFGRSYFRNAVSHVVHTPRRHLHPNLDGRPAARRPSVAFADYDIADSRPSNIVDHLPQPPLPSSSSCSSSSSFTASRSADWAPAMHIDTTPTITNTTTVSTSDKDPVYTCPQCDRTFNSHIGLVGHMKIHRPEPNKPVPGA
nr:unnamed protein product [Spirometra erinaceieuropaei]